MDQMVLNLKRDKIDDFKKMVNEKLSSNPQLPGDSWFTGKSAEENAKTSSQINSVNPDGIKPNMTKATDAFQKFLKQSQRSINCSNAKGRYWP